MATEIVSGQRGLVNMPSDIAQPPQRDRESAAEKSSGADKPPGCRERALAAPSQSRAHHSMNPSRGRSLRVLDLDPIRRPSRAIWHSAPLCDDALSAANVEPDPA